jgi:hypothetical protein
MRIPVAGVPGECRSFLATKKAAVAEHPAVFGHVGLLVTDPPGSAELLFI